MTAAAAYRYARPMSGAQPWRLTPSRTGGRDRVERWARLTQEERQVMLAAIVAEQDVPARLLARLEVTLKDEATDATGAERMAARRFRPWWSV